MSRKKQVRLIAITHATGSHPRGWRHPDSPARPATDAQSFIAAVQELERGLFDGIFISETAGTMPGPAEAHQHDSMINDSLDPTVLLSAIATQTKHIGLITTGSTSLTQPYTFARLLASLDHISGGRVGWNVVTSRFETEARNFGIDPRLLHGPLRYEIATEFVDIVKRLWDSAPVNARTHGPQNEQAFDPSSVKPFDYRGTHFRVSGALDVQRPPQGHPVIVQAGMSEEGRDLTAREADIVLGGGWNARQAREDIRRRAQGYGRDPDALIVLALLPYILVAETRDEAEAQLRAFTALLHPDERQQHGILAGSSTDIADLMENWLDGGGADGFAVGFPYLRGPVEAFTRLVIPELQRRGRFRTEYSGTTLRENLGIPLPPARYDAVEPNRMRAP